MIQKMMRSPVVRLAALAPSALLGGCSWDLLDPAGTIGHENLWTTTSATLMMLVVVVPTIVLTLVFAWRYRASNLSADYAPEWAHSNRIEAVIWIVPALIVASLGVIVYRTTHELDPYKPIVSSQKPLEVEVVSLDWKWLFIYPEYGVASVNQLAMPVGRPVHFDITSDGVMNAFFVPRLGSMVYSMAGMQTQLSLVASKPGVYQGLSSNFSGDGFADMRFQAHALDDKAFDAWIAQAKSNPAGLDMASYGTLAKPSENDPVRLYGHVAPNLFHDVLMKDMKAAPGTHMAGMAMPTQQD